MQFSYKLSKYAVIDPTGGNGMVFDIYNASPRTTMDYIKLVVHKDMESIGVHGFYDVSNMNLQPILQVYSEDVADKIINADHEYSNVGKYDYKHMALNEVKKFFRHGVIDVKNEPLIQEPKIEGEDPLDDEDENDGKTQYNYEFHSCVYQPNLSEEDAITVEFRIRVKDNDRPDPVIVYKDMMDLGIHMSTYNPMEALLFIHTTDKSSAIDLINAYPNSTAEDKEAQIKCVEKFFAMVNDEDESVKKPETKEPERKLNYTYQFRGMKYGPYRKRFVIFDVFGTVDDDTKERYRKINKDMSALSISNNIQTGELTQYGIRSIAPYNYKVLEVYKLEAAKKIIYECYKDDPEAIDAICRDMETFFSAKMNYKIL